MNTITLLSELLKFRHDSTLTAQKVEEAAKHRFTSLTEKIYYSSKFYRDLYSSHGIKPGDLKEIVPADLPIINKSMVMDNFNSLITDPSITFKSVEDFLSNDKNPRNRFRNNLRLAFLGFTGGHYAGVTLTSDAPKFLYNTKLFPNPEGTKGSLLITPLYRTLQPLIRYRLTDTMALKKSDSPFISIDKITGRTNDILVFVDSKGIKHKIHLYPLLEFYVPGLRQFQFEQITPSEILLRISVYDGNSDSKQLAQEKLNEILIETGIAEFVSANVELVASIGLNPKTGKLNVIVPYTKKEETSNHL